MKKLLLLLMIASFGIAGSVNAQKNSNKNWNKKHHKNHDRDDDRYDRRDDRNWDYNDRYNNNAPRKVRDAFNRDYPNASNVRWSKDRGVWTASFRRTGLFGGNNTVSYRANGQRTNVYNNNNNNNGIFGSRRNV